ncbi:hypothetical protein PG994_004647 [Apiospora phragmitis]|uniref:DUF8032 domain-containing protein n=1 Tax=Apiospora phragmitis TaxID=2905665 RepID=A0ABR1VRA3_9PEZI
MGVSSMQHHPHHSQGPAPPQHLQHPRPSSIVHQHHQAPPPQSQQQHPSAYSSTHSIQPAYQSTAQAPSAQQHAQDGLPYYHHPSPYSTPGATSGYTSADTSEMMAATQMPRPYPPMSYHTPQSNSPASVASPSGHDQHRSMYAQPPSQLHQQSMYYSTQQSQYPSMPQPAAPSPYQQHAQQPHPSMASQNNMMMSQAPQHPMTQHTNQHAQSAMTGSPRHTKMEPQVPQLQRPSSGPLGTPQHSQNGAPPLSTPTGSTPGVNNNAAPGPIPATTPLVVRQDNNGVQWIAFEYSRDRVKMEYTIRCDVESVNTDELASDFKTENCVYPRACCPKDQYRGNRLQYETECNTVGWALAQLNPCLRGKRGLIQRAVDSWRNSNQDPRLRSRRVRRMAKMNNRKAVSTPHPTHMSGPSGPAGIPAPGSMGPGNSSSMGKPGMSGMGPGMHHHHQDGNGQGGDEVGTANIWTRPTITTTRPLPDRVLDLRMTSDPPRSLTVILNPTLVTLLLDPPCLPFMMASAVPPTTEEPSLPAIPGTRTRTRRVSSPDIPEAKKRKFILVEDNKRGCRLRVRVTLESVDTKEIPDSFRKSSSVFPRSYFPREMQSPPPSATGSQFFQEDLSDDEVEVEGGRTGRSRGNNGRGRSMVKVPMSDGSDGEVAIPRTRKTTRGKEVRLNDLGYRMAWLQSRVFSGRTIFLQRALDCYRNKTRTAIETVMQDVKTVAPHYETRVGKRKWSERIRKDEKRDDE